MSISKFLITVAFLFIIKVQISAQDSTIIQDPAPVVITQEGYTQEANPENIPLNQRTFKQRLKYGGSFGPFSFSNFQTVIGLSPMIGYRLTEHTIIGAGTSLIFWRISAWWGGKCTESVLLTTHFARDVNPLLCGKT